MDYTLELKGLTRAPGQCWGAIRLVPLLRQDQAREALEGLRLHSARYEGPQTMQTPTGVYTSTFVPHAFILHDESASLGGQMVTKRGRIRSYRPSRRKQTRLHRKLDGDKLMFLPLHLAMEGFLALHLSGPDVAYSSYAAEVLSRGLEREEYGFTGSQIQGLEEALRVFECVEGQVGMLFFVADALASAVVMPHAEDYARVHRHLLSDFFPDLLVRYGAMYEHSAGLETTLDATKIEDLSDLRRGYEKLRAQWIEQEKTLSEGLFERSFRAKQVQELRGNKLLRLLPDFDPDEENHVAEAIYAPGGQLAYLKTMRLSAAQSRRARLLDELAASEWDMAACAEKLGCDEVELRRRIRRNGLEQLLRRRYRS